MMKNWVDPEAKAEAERYDNPIPSRTLILESIEKRSIIFGFYAYSFFCASYFPNKKSAMDNSNKDNEDG